VPQLGSGQEAGGNEETRRAMIARLVCGEAGADEPFQR
jgi:hypothetical protein